MYLKISEELLAKHFAKETSEQEEKEIQLWLMENPDNQQLYEELYLAWTNPINLEKSHFNKDRVYQKINDAIIDEKRNVKQLSKRKYLKFAASILLFIGLATTWLLFFNAEPEMLSKKTEYGQKMRITLPDGSLVHLNSGSSIEYPEKFGAENRIIQLKGEGFFEVKRNPKKPFIVKTEAVETKVLGTSFNINAYHLNDPSITVASGSVQVSTDSQTLILNPNQRAYLAENELKSENILAQNDILWKDGILKFMDTPMLTVKNRLEKWYNVEIQFEEKSLQNCVFTGQFKNEKLMIVLEVLKETFSITYEVKSKLIIIKGKGC